MRDLCAALEMSPGAFYRYFDSKEAVIAAMVDADRAKMEKVFAEIPFETPFPELISQMVMKVLENLTNDHELTIFSQITAEGAVNPKVAEALKTHYAVVTDRMELLIRRAQERKEVDTAIKPRDAAIFIISTFDGLCPRSAFDPSVNWRKMALVFIGVILRALGSVEPKSKGVKS